MNQYGQPITWGTPAAPQLFTGKCTSYSYADAVSRRLFDDMVGDNVALALEGRKAAISFEAEVTDGSVDFLDLSGGAAVAVSGIAGGVVLASRALERWRLGQRKACSIQATHYPDVTPASPALAGTDLDAFTPDQSGLITVSPAATIIYGTHGLGHASGVLHALTIEQQLTLTEAELSPAGQILTVNTHGYLRTIQLDLLCVTGMGARPAVRSILTLTGAPGHAEDYRIEKSEEKFADKRGKMYAIEAVWISPFSV